MDGAERVTKKFTEKIAMSIVLVNITGSRQERLGTFLRICRIKGRMARNCHCCLFTEIIRGG